MPEPEYESRPPVELELDEDDDFRPRPEPLEEDAPDPKDLSVPGPASDLASQAETGQDFKQALTPPVSVVKVNTPVKATSTGKPASSPPSTPAGKKGQPAKVTP